VNDGSNASFGLGAFSNAEEGPFPGLVVDDRVFDLRPALGSDTTTLSLLQDWGSSLETLRELRDSDLAHGQPLSELRVHAPVASGQVFGAGANYHKHVRQIMLSGFRSNPDERRSDDELRAAAENVLREHAKSGQPYVYCAPSAALCGPYDDVVLWRDGTQHDWELELAVVIGRHASNVDVASAMDYVAGYTISNDVTTRDLIERPGFPLTDLSMAKCRPTFFPTGPYIVPSEFVPDYRELRITLAVNAEVMQDELVADIIFGVDKLVAYASSVVDLAPGDLLLTGSPAGNAGHHGDRWLRPGDIMDGAITGLGQQRNVCVADPRP
jgi:2-keto-4-pentenoate hydratase/2-oxohepta-3-ene-1,7-dioic acid hydratase in catechol pathway